MAALIVSACPGGTTRSSEPCMINIGQDNWSTWLIGERSSYSLFFSGSGPTSPSR